MANGEFGLCSLFFVWLFVMTPKLLNCFIKLSSYFSSCAIFIARCFCFSLNPQKIVTTDPKGDGNRRRDEKKRKKSLFFEKGLDFFAKV